MSSFEQKMERYAELAVKVGANVQPGQTLVVNAMIEAAPLVRLIVKKAYETGAKQVKVNYSDEIVNRIRYDLAPDEAFWNRRLITQRKLPNLLNKEPLS